MPNVGAEFTASIVIDKNDLIAQALKQLSTAQKELEKNKLEIYFDLSNADLSKKLKEYQRQLSSTDYTIKINNNGIEETYKSLDKLLDIVKTIASGKDFGTGFGNINTDNAVKQIDKLEKRISELTKKYEELQKKSSSTSGGISGKDVNLVDNEEFKKLSDSFEKIKGEVDDLKTHMSLLSDSTVSGDNFLKLGSQVDGLSAKLDDLLGKYVELSNAQKNLGIESNISLGDSETPKKDKYAKRSKISEEDFLNYSPTKVNKKLSNSGYTILGETVNTELVNGLVKVSAKIKDTDGAWKSFSAKVDADGNIFEQRFRTITNGVDKLETALENFGRETSPALTYQETLDKAQKIKNSLNLGDEYSIKVDSSEFVTITKKLTDIENAGTSVTQTFKSAQDAIDNFGKAASNSAEKTSVALKSVKNKDQLKDAFPKADTKLDNTISAAKELDKALKQVDIPTDSFDEVLKKLDRAKTELVDIVKITEKSSADKDGKFHTSYTLKDSRGSTEIYGLNSKTDKGQLLDHNIVRYDKKKDELDISKAQLEVDKQLAKEEEELAKAQQKKVQAFQKEQANYENEQKKAEFIKEQKATYDELTNTISRYSDIAKRVASRNAEDGDFELMTKLEDKISQLQKQPILSDSQVEKSEKSLVSLYNQLDKIEKKTAETNQRNQDNAIQAEWDKNVQAIQDYMDAVTKLNNLKAKDKGTDKNKNQIELQTQKVEELKQVAYDARANLTSMFNPHNVDIDTWIKWVNAMKQFDQASEGSAESVAKLEDALRSVNESQKKYMSSVVSKQQNYLGDYHTFMDREDYLPTNNFREKFSAYESEFNKLQYLADQLSKQDFITQDQLKDFEILKKHCEELRKALTNMNASDKGAWAVDVQKEIDKINSDLMKNSNYSEEAKQKLRGFIELLKAGNISDTTLKEIHNEFLKITNAEKLAGREGKNFFDILKNSRLHQMAAQMAGMFSVYDVINAGKQGVQIIRELDEAMTEVRKVSEATEFQYKSFQKTISATAKEIASTNKELLNSSADFLRLGYSLDQAKNLAENATLFVNVGDGVDINEATEDMITAMKAFDIKAEESIKIVDSYNQIGNLFALSASDIGEAMKRSASALETGNNSFEESIALITAMNEIVQNSENTGNALKVLSLRLRGAKAELENMSEDTDGLCESTSKLREQIQSLTGVDIMIDENNFKSTAEIIKELGAVWDNLSDTSQAATLELIAGKSRSNNVAALLKNYKQIDEVLAKLENAEGSALRENNAIVDSINGRIKILSASMEEFWQVLINDSVIKNAISALTTLVEGATEFVDTVGVFPTLLTSIGATLSIKGHGKRTIMFQW